MLSSPRVFPWLLSFLFTMGGFWLAAAEVTTVEVSSDSVVISHPVGFSKLERGSATFDGIQKGIGYGELLAVFEMAGAGEGAGVRRCHVQVQPEHAMHRSRKVDFAEMVGVFEKEIADARAAKSETSVEQMPIHERSERTAAYSMILDDPMRPGKKSVVTCLLALINARTLQFYVHSPYESESDLQWTRETASGWVAQTTAANQPTLEQLAHENSNLKQDFYERRWTILGGLLLILAAVLYGKYRPQSRMLPPPQ
jgi:hypothetical protein